MDSTESPRALAHVGVAVPDIEEAIEWYTDVLGWRHLKGPRTSTEADGYGGRRAVDVLGAYSEMKVAQLLTGNGIGVELFEFADASEARTPAFPRTGYFHICVVDPDVAGLAAKIDESGGDHYSDVWRLDEDSDTYLLTYCRDPFGNLMEIYSHSHEEMHATTPRPGDAD